jgi:hypothetical protein
MSFWTFNYGNRKTSDGNIKHSGESKGPTLLLRPLKLLLGQADALAEYDGTGEPGSYGQTDAIVRICFQYWRVEELQWLNELLGFPGRPCQLATCWRDYYFPISNSIVDLSLGERVRREFTRIQRR